MSRGQVYRKCPACGKRGVRWENHMLICKFCRHFEGR